jgi:hypothetical protein
MTGRVPMNYRGLKARAVLAGLMTMSVLAAPAVQAAGMTDLIRETQRLTQNEGQITMVWWMPVQFWEESLKGNSAVTPEARAQLLAPLAEYSLLAMIRAKATAGGVTDIQPKAELVKNLKVTANGKVLEPLAPEQIAPGAQLLMAQLKPGLTAMGGPAMQGVEFVVYPTKVDGKPVIDALQPGTLEVTLYEQTSRWRTPLGSLLPERVDAKTGEEFPGNYQFNPFTGDKLKAR